MTGRTDSTRMGFSLIEMAVVLGLITLILGFALSLGSNAVNAAHRVNTQERMATIKQAIEHYANSNGYYPCPADRSQIPGFSGNFGFEARNAGACVPNAPGIVQVGGNYIGTVPVMALGLPSSFAADAWGNKFTYAVGVVQVSSANSIVSDQPAITIRSGDRASGDNYIITSTTNRAVVPSTPAAILPGSGASYVLISHGPDGRGAYPLDRASVATPCGSGSQTDLANCDDTDSVYYDTAYNDGDNESLYFDDYIVWGSNALKRSPIQPGGPGSCPSGSCEEWCAPCLGVIANIPLPHHSFTSPQLCKKIITSTLPCYATCIWGGVVSTPPNEVVKCP